MKREVATFVVTVELDPVPGIFNSPESAEETIRQILQNSISHYSPVVTNMDDGRIKMDDIEQIMVNSHFNCTQVRLTIDGLEQLVCSVPSHTAWE